MIDLLRREIRNKGNYPIESIWDVYCSKAFYDCIQEELNKMFEHMQTRVQALDGILKPGQKPVFIRLCIPDLGYLHFHPDLEEGYKITRVESTKNS